MDRLGERFGESGKNRFLRTRVASLDEQRNIWRAASVAVLMSGNPAVVSPEALRPVTLRPQLSLGLPFYRLIKKAL